MKKKILLSLLASSVLVAQNIELEPLSVTSTAIKTDELRATDAVEIYTAEEIEKAHVQNIYEFLNQQTSVTTMPSYGNPFTQKLDMRGYGIGDGYQNIVITIDGRKINNIDMVPPLLSAISPASIERLEIIKSTGIVIGGDGANAGTINIITKKKSAKEVAVYMGTHGTADGSFYLGHSDEKLSASASGEAQKSNGVRNINSSGDKDENSLTTGTFNLSYLPVEELELRVGASFARTDVLYTSSLTLEEYNNETTTKISHHAGGRCRFADPAAAAPVVWQCVGSYCRHGIALCAAIAGAQHCGGLRGFARLGLCRVFRHWGLYVRPDVIAPFV